MRRFTRVCKSDVGRWQAAVLLDAFPGVLRVLVLVQNWSHGCYFTNFRPLTSPWRNFKAVDETERMKNTTLRRHDLTASLISYNNGHCYAFSHPNWDAGYDILFKTVISGGEYQKGKLNHLNAHSMAASFNSECTTQEGPRHGQSGDESCDHKTCRRLI